MQEMHYPPLRLVVNNDAPKQPPKKRKKAAPKASIAPPAAVVVPGYGIPGGGPRAPGPGVPTYGVLGRLTPADSNSTTRLLKAVLDAKLTKTLTVEQACHLDMFTKEGTGLQQFLDDFTQLHAAGLDICGVYADAPDAIVLRDVDVFTARFPHLVDAVAPMLAHEGVLPYTRGEPRFNTPEMRGFNDEELAKYVARQLILEHDIGGKTVRQAIEDGSESDSQAQIVNMLVLDKFGIHLSPNSFFMLEDEDKKECAHLANGYAQLFKPAKMSRRIPALKKLGIDLNHLEIY